MTSHSSSAVRMILAAAAVLVLAALACSPGGTSVPPTAVPTTVPATPVPPTAAPTDVPPTTAPNAGKPTPAGSSDSGGDTGGGTTVSADALTASNVADITELWSMDASQTALFATSASPTSHQVATFGGDSTVRAWDGDTGDQLWEQSTANFGFGLAYSPDGSVLASGAGYHVQMWDAGNGQMLRDVTVNADVFRIVWTPDSSALAVVGSQSSRIIVIDPYEGTVISEIPSDDGRELWAIAFTPDGRYMATSNVNGYLRVYDIDAAEIVFESSQPQGAGWDLEFSPDSARLASCNGGGGVWIWDTSSWQVDLSGDNVHPGGCTDGAFSLDSSVYFSVGDDGYLNAWEVASGDLLTYLSANVPLWTVSVSGDGELLALALDDGTVSIVGLP